MINQRLKQIRAEHGMTQAQAAALVGKSWRSWVGYEIGERTPPESILELFCLKLDLPYPETFDATKPDTPRRPG